jgi:hypothetical protein
MVDGRFRGSLRDRIEPPESAQPTNQPTNQQTNKQTNPSHWNPLPTPPPTLGCGSPASAPFPNSCSSPHESTFPDPSGAQKVSDSSNALSPLVRAASSSASNASFSSVERSVCRRSRLTREGGKDGVYMVREWVGCGGWWVKWDDASRRRVCINARIRLGNAPRFPADVRAY